MKYIFFLIFFFTFSINSKDYLFESGGINSNLNEETIQYPDGSKFIVYKGNNTAWKDSEGDYGKEKCIGYVNINKKNNANVHFRCITTNQNGDKFWTTRIRNSEVAEGGGGINTYLAGTGKYKKMIGLKCPYGVKYHQDAVWYTHKCKLN